MKMETERLAEQLRRACHGEAWHGPALRELLQDVTAAQAVRRPLGGAHSIWEIVRHIAVWERVVRLRLAGERIVELPPAEDWPAVTDTSEQAWQRTLRQLDEGNRQLREAIEALDGSRLSEPVYGKAYDVYTMLHGVVQHDLYHAGQIALLKKAVMSDK